MDHPRKLYLVGPLPGDDTFYAIHRGGHNTCKVVTRAIGQYNPQKGLVWGKPVWRLQGMKGPCDIWIHVDEYGQWCVRRTNPFSSDFKLEDTLLRCSAASQGNSPSESVDDWQVNVCLGCAETWATWQPVHEGITLVETPLGPKNIVLSVRFDEGQGFGGQVTSRMIASFCGVLVYTHFEEMPWMIIVFLIALLYTMCEILNAALWYRNGILLLVFFAARVGGSIPVVTLAFALWHLVNLFVIWVEQHELIPRLRIKFKLRPIFVCSHLLISGCVWFQLGFRIPIVVVIYELLLKGFWQQTHAEHAATVTRALGIDRCYCPNKYSKGTCSNKHCDGIQGQCEKWSDPPTDDSCWRSSYRWHLQRERNGERATMLRIKQGKLGKGQIVEERIRTQLGIDVREIEVSSTQNDHTVLLMVKNQLHWLE